MSQFTCIRCSRIVASALALTLMICIAPASFAQKSPESEALGLKTEGIRPSTATPGQNRPAKLTRRFGKLGSAGPIDDATWQFMQGKSWHPNIGCPARDQLSLLKIPFLDFFGQEQLGVMIVAKDVSVEVIQIFAELYRVRFPIASMRLVDEFGGRDLASMAANNTSAFNCRPVTAGSRPSEHSFGIAIDINPIQNPYVRGLRILPAAGQQFGSSKRRLEPKPGLLIEGDPVVTSFAKRGWKWGGSWASVKDYQHFSKSGR